MERAVTVFVASHYSIEHIKEEDGMSRLRTMFPDGEANCMNFVLFSTSGIHGSYSTIEDVEDELAKGDVGASAEITFLIVHPRIVCIRYGNATVTREDIPYLKKLRASSIAAVSEIGME